MTTAFPVRIFIGQIRPLPESGRPSAIYKQAVSGAIEIGPNGIIGDQQADLRVHGGPDKAVHLYPAAHYRRLAERFPEIAPRFQPGSLGENLSCASLTEADVRVGDIWRLGDARLQICQPRSPCWKIDERFGLDGIAEFIAREGLTGWYWRVLTPGPVAAGALLRHESSPPGKLSLAGAQALLQEHRPIPSALAELAESPGIADNWRQKIVQRLSWLRANPDRTPPAPAGFHVKPENQG